MDEKFKDTARPWTIEQRVLYDLRKIQFTTYKAEWAGRNVEQVNPRNTTKTCSVCGHIQDMPLSERIYVCPCGNVMDRDHNAAINILNKIGQGLAESTPVELVALAPT